VERRHIKLEGNLNLRDLGGYQSADGSVVRAGCLFRSDELHALTDADLEVVGSLGIKVVFDLRADHERAARPNRLPPDVELLERTSPSAGGPGPTLEEQIALDQLPVRDDEEFAGVYIDLLDRLAPELRIILDRAVDSPNRPLLFHCAAGKDRTGLTAAILLGLLGVPNEVILDDYELTSTYFTPGRMDALAEALAKYSVPEDRIRPLLEARRPVLATTLRHLHERWGGFDGYVEQHLKVLADLPHRLRAALLVPSRSSS
jgi:protein-tyrosine phosphatase